MLLIFKTREITERSDVCEVYFRCFGQPFPDIGKIGERIRDYSRVYRCLNRECGTVYFTRPPKGVELYARVHRDVKTMVLRWVFHLRGSLSRVCDELADHGIKVALTTVLRWVKKAGEECVDALHVCEQEDWEQPLCIDEKWIKVRSRWGVEGETDIAPSEAWERRMKAIRNLSA